MVLIYGNEATWEALHGDRPPEAGRAPIDVRRVMDGAELRGT
jgi:hypothetical protein